MQAGQPVHLLGWSLGGGVALQYAADHPCAVASIVLESPMSPFGFGGTRDTARTPCWPDFAGSGGIASAEMVRRIAAGDRGADDATSPRRVLTTLYGQAPFDLAPDVEDALVEAMLEMAVGDDYYPGDQVGSANWPATAPGERGVNNAISPRFCDVSGFADVTGWPGVAGPAGCAVDPRRRRPDRVRTPHWWTLATSVRWARCRAGPGRTSIRRSRW